MRPRQGKADRRLGHQGGRSSPGRPGRRVPPRVGWGSAGEARGRGAPRGTFSQPWAGEREREGEAEPTAGSSGSVAHTAYSQPRTRPGSTNQEPKRVEGRGGARTNEVEGNGGAREAPRRGQALPGKTRRARESPSDPAHPGSPGGALTLGCPRRLSRTLWVLTPSGPGPFFFLLRLL